MLDLFGIKARQDCLSHLHRICQLEDQIAGLKATVEIQAQRIEALKNETPFMYDYIDDLDFPNKRGN